MHTLIDSTVMKSRQEGSVLALTLCVCSSWQLLGSRVELWALERQSNLGFVCASLPL